MVRTGVTRAFGAALRRYLANSTRNRFAGFGVGLGVTGLLQSSTATALIISSFASRALIPAAAAFAVMLGADVGTTLVAQVLSFDLSSLVPVLLIVGVISFMTAKVGRRRHLGRAAVGLGLMLLSLRLIVGASEPVRESAVLEAIITPLSNEPWLALVIAAAVAWLAHSSLAIVLLIMSLAATSVIPLILAFTLVLGANIGGAIAPVALTFGGDALARRVPVGNLIMRLTGGLIALPLIGVVAPLLASVESEPARQIANFHTMFNLSLAIVFLPLVDLVSRLSALLLPGTEKADDATRPRYLDPAALDMPSVALGSAARETLRMGDTVERMLRSSIEVFQRNDIQLASEIEAMDNSVDELHEAIKLYLTKVSQEELDTSESRHYVEILTFTTNLEHIGDIIDKNLMELAAKKIRNQLTFSPAGFQDICNFHGRVVDNLQLALNVFVTRDVKLARKLLAEKTAMRDAELSAAESHFNRLRARRPETIETSSLHLDVIRDLKRINSHITSVAYPILEEAGELRESRLKGSEVGDRAMPAGADARSEQEEFMSKAKARGSGHA